MTNWAALRTELANLRDRQPNPLTGYPDPRAEDHSLPARIRLAAWAADEAEQLHRRFGTNVTLTVGAMAYPDPQDTPGYEAPAEPASPDELTVALATPLTIRSGHHESTRLLVTNHTGTVMRIQGAPPAVISDPDTGRAVGGYSGAVAAVLIIHSIPPSATTPLPLLVATTSHVAALGYAIPPGRWTIHTTLTLIGHRTVRTPPLPLIIN
jgi:hypothetical protein